jgi:hypothetical protein
MHCRRSPLRLVVPAQAGIHAEREQRGMKVNVSCSSNYPGKTNQAMEPTVENPIDSQDKSVLE